ncbi:hypothetical protein EON83_11120 [bacterium]|nr:MAG: hypothetical protein EON83_11120 [bacterium]
MESPDTKKEHVKLSYGRGVPLWNLSALCRLLQIEGTDLRVRDLANRGIEQGVFGDKYKFLHEGDRLHTRINHHIIALRCINLIDPAIEKKGVCRLRPRGLDLAHAVQRTIPDALVQGSTESWESLEMMENVQDEVLPELRATWREILVQSLYVRSHWLRYFMDREEFSLKDFVDAAKPIRILVSPAHDNENDTILQRRGKSIPQTADSGYRLSSHYWPQLNWTEEQRREVFQGLRLWTKQAYLTDDTVLGEVAGPFKHLSSERSKGQEEDNIYEFESYPVKCWLYPLRDLDQFVSMVNEVLAFFPGGRRATLPDLIISLCQRYNLAKRNVKEMLSQLYFLRNKDYFFERGSRFLVENAFAIRTTNKPESYYLKLDGSWRVGIVRQK